MDASVRTVQDVDIERYMGRWFEIARYPAFFQRRCAKNTVAEYALRPNGTVRIENRCTAEDGRIIRARGIARPVPGSAAKFKVKFFPLAPAADYWIVDLDPQYRWAVVSEPKRRFLWILSRAPSMDPATFEGIEQRLSAQHFDPARLMRTPQDGA